MIHVVQEWSAEQEAEAEIRNNPKNTTTFVVANLNSVDWERTGKEFEKDGKLYDVISITPSTIGYQIIAWCDENENELESNWEAFTNEKKDSNSENHSLASTIQVLPFLVPTFEYNLSFYSESTTTYPPFIAQAIASFHPGILIPPPEFC